MRILRNLVLTAGILTGACSFLKGQQYPARSLQAGISLVGAEDKYEGRMSGLGLQVDYQRNFNEWYSLRPSLQMNWFSHYESTFYTESPAGYLYQLFEEISYKNLSFDLAHLVYLRERYVNFYLGIGLGGDFLFRSIDRITEKESSSGVNTQTQSTSKSFIMAHARPMLGISFKIGPSREQELDLSLAYQYQTTDLLGQKNPVRVHEFSFIEIGLGYRYNFDQ